MNIIKITYLTQHYADKKTPAIVEYCQTHNVSYDCRTTARPYAVGVTVFLMVDLCKMKVQYLSCLSGPMYEGALFTVDDNNEFVSVCDRDPFYIYEYMTYDVLPYTVEQAKQFSEAFDMKFPWLI